MIDLREQMHQVTITAEMKHNIKFKNKWIVFLGLGFIRFGCLLSGINYETPNDT